MTRYKIRDITFECDEVKGTATVGTPGHEEYFSNAIEGWNTFVSCALQPLERDLRDKLEENGFNRWTGTRNHMTETELKIFDELIAFKSQSYEV